MGPKNIIIRICQTLKKSLSTIPFHLPKNWKVSLRTLDRLQAANWKYSQLRADVCLGPPFCTVELLCNHLWPFIVINCLFVTYVSTKRVNFLWIEILSVFLCNTLSYLTQYNGICSFQNYILITWCIQRTILERCYCRHNMPTWGL